MRIAGSQTNSFSFPVFLLSLFITMSSERRKPYPFDQIEPKWQRSGTSGKFSRA